MSEIFCRSSSRSSMIDSLPDRHDLLAELQRIERLGDDRDGAQLAKPGHLGGHRLSSHEYYRDACEARIRTHTLQRRRAVRARHHDIEQHEVRRYVRQALQRALARFADFDSQACDQAERQLDDLPDVRLVVDIQHRPQPAPTHGAAFVLARPTRRRTVASRWSTESRDFTSAACTRSDRSRLGSVALYRMTGGAPLPACCSTGSRSRPEPSPSAASRITRSNSSAST